MNPQDALNIIDQALMTIEANRATHIQLQQALVIVSTIVNNAIAKPADGSKSVPVARNLDIVHPEKVKDK